MGNKHIVSDLFEQFSSYRSYWLKFYHNDINSLKKNFYSPIKIIQI